MTALQALLIFLISFMVVAVLFKMPVSFALGTSSLLVLAFGGYNLVTVPQFAFSGLDSFALLAIPFYIFAGVIMEYSGISKMLIDWIKSFVGRIRGATGVITICACMAFGVLTGSAMATISAIGKMMVPELEKEGYPKSRVPIKQYLQKLPKWGRFGVTSVTPFLLLPVHPEGCTPARRT